MIGAIGRAGDLISQHRLVACLAPTAVRQLKIEKADLESDPSGFATQRRP
jgi:hypothetical protein